MNVLRTLPIKELPKEIFYLRRVNTVMHPTQLEYIALSTVGDRNWGEVVLHKRNECERLEDFNGPCLIVDWIRSTQRGKGLGKAMLNFCKNYSKQIGCEGRIILLADNTFTPERVPHLFYRKQGFSTFNKKLDRKMDRFIKKDKPATYKDFSSDIMYYPVPTKETFWESLKCKFLK